jgi:hypothetical protein
MAGETPDDPAAKEEATRLAEIRARADKATPGPWYRADGDLEGFPGSVDVQDERSFGICSMAERGAYADSADFIAHARADIPWLLERLRDSALECVSAYGQAEDACLRLAAAERERDAAQAKLAVAESWGMTFGLMKTSDRPEPYWMVADPREGSTLARMAKAEDELIIAGIERDAARESLKVAANALDRAAEDIGHWGNYADEHAQRKWKLSLGVWRVKGEAAAARAAAEGIAPVPAQPAAAPTDTISDRDLCAILNDIQAKASPEVGHALWQIWMRLMELGTVRIPLAALANIVGDLRNACYVGGKMVKPDVYGALGDIFDRARASIIPKENSNA